MRNLLRKRKTLIMKRKEKRNEKMERKGKRRMNTGIALIHGQYCL